MPNSRGWNSGKWGIPFLGPRLHGAVITMGLSLFPNKTEPFEIARSRDKQPKPQRGHRR